MTTKNPIERARHIALTAAAISAMAIAIAPPAQALPFTAHIAEQSSDTRDADFTFNIAVPANMIGDATLTLALDGDFNSSNESAQVSIDGLRLGTIADGQTANDDFDFANSDDPDPNSRAGNPFTGSAIIAMADLAPLLADGFLALLVDTNYNVDMGTTTVSGTLSFETGAATQAQVPEPSVLSMLAAVLLLGGLTRLVDAGVRSRFQV